MARAKRTDRAEARRQYRAYLASQEEAEAAAAAEGAAEQSQARSSIGRRPAQQGDQGPRPGERLGMFAAARAATRSPTYLKDVRDIVWLVTRTRAVWPIALLGLAGVAIAFPRIHSNEDVGSDPILSIIVQFVLNPMPLLPPMLAGFLAPRATWLAGAIAAAISTGLFILMVAVTPVATPVTALASPSATAAAAASTGASPNATAVETAAPTAESTATPQNGSGVAPISTADLPGAAVTWIVSALPFGALMGAGAGWYKRFLEYIGPRGTNGRKPQPKKPARRTGRR